MEELAAFSTIGGLMTAVLSLIAGAMRATVIPQGDGTPSWKIISAGSQFVALSTVILSVWTAMSGQLGYFWKSLALGCLLAVLAYVLIVFALKRVRACEARSLAQRLARVERSGFPPVKR